MGLPMRCKNCKKNYTSMWGPRCRVDGKMRGGNTKCKFPEEFDIVDRLKEQFGIGGESVEKPQQSSPAPKKVQAPSPGIRKIEPDKSPEPVQEAAQDPPVPPSPEIRKVTGGCEAVTGSGKPCKNKALPGKRYCRLKKHKEQVEGE